MMGPWPLWALILAFLVASAAIWWAGTRLERYADAISQRTGLGQAFTGVLLLATVTSLPEVATTVTAVVVLRNPALAVNNLLGGVAFQTAILVVADAFTKRSGPLTYFSPRFALLIQGVGLLLLLQLALAGLTAKGVPIVAGVSVWAVLMAAVYGGIVYLVYRHRGHPRWTPSTKDDFPAEERDQAEADRREDGPSPGAGSDERSTRALWLRFAVMSVIVLAGGFAATECADALAGKTGISAEFLGATLLAAATSLPEVSTTISAVKAGRYTTAISNVFGSNAFDVSLLVLAEALHRGGSVFAEQKPAVTFVAIVGSAMTCVYLCGLLERENKQVLRIGWDSVVAGALYLGGMGVLYAIQ